MESLSGSIQSLIDWLLLTSHWQAPPSPASGLQRWHSCDHKCRESLQEQEHKSTTFIKLLYAEVQANIPAKVPSVNQHNPQLRTNEGNWVKNNSWWMSVVLKIGSKYIIFTLLLSWMQPRWTVKVRLTEKRKCFSHMSESFTVWTLKN